MGVVEPKTKKPRQMPRLCELVKAKSPAVGWALCVVSHTRKIDMMGLIYDQSATTVKRHL
jgi:hypothetical protein